MTERLHFHFSLSCIGEGNGNPLQWVSLPAKSSQLSDSLQPYGLEPTRLLCPWDSPGKNTEMGCHSLPQRIYPTQGSYTPSPALKEDSLLLHHQGSPENH